MSYSARDWWNDLTYRRDIRREIPTATTIHGTYEYVVYSGSEDPEYQRQCAAWRDHEGQTLEARARERLRIKMMAELFTELWERRMAGESIDDIRDSEAA